MKFPDLDGFFPGARWKNEYGSVRIMGTVDHYVVYRRAGAKPAIEHYNTFLNKHIRAASLDPRRRSI